MANTIGASVFESDLFSNQIEGVVKHLTEAGSKIKEVRPPKAEATASYTTMLSDVAKYRGRPLFYNYIGSGLGNGAYVELADGSVKLDLINGIGVHILGHSHPKVLAGALRGAATDIVMQGNLQPNQEYLLMEKMLHKIATRKSRLEHIWFATCGTIANENALKICRQKKNGARMVLAFNNAFAGRSTMMAEITDNAAYKVGQPTYNEILRLPFCDHKSDQRTRDKTLAILKEHVAKHENNIGCFVFEPMLGEGGYKYPDRAFLVSLLDFCKEKQIPIWADEIQTFARTGEFFAFETFDIGSYIDVCTVAKTVQNGATLYTKEMNPNPALLGGTFSGSGASLAAGMAVLEELQSGGYMGANGKIKKIHQEFIGMLNELNETTCKGLVRDADGLGLMMAFTPLDGSKEKQLTLLKKMFEKGLMTFGCGHDPYRIRFLVPAIIESKDIKVAKKIIEESILELA